MNNFIAIMLVVLIELAIAGMVFTAYNHGYSNRLDRASKIIQRMQDTGDYANGYNDGWNFCYKTSVMDDETR